MTYATIKRSSPSLTHAEQPLLAKGRPRRSAETSKLRIGHPNSPLEQAADKAAAEVMKMPSVGSVTDRAACEAGVGPSGNGAVPVIMRACEACSEEEIQRKPQTSMVNDNREGSPQNRSQDNVQSMLAAERHSGGRPLSANLRSYMEPRFGESLDDVRVHTTTRASILAQELSARAFTVGQDIFFKKGEFSPSTSPGRLLIAHELAHTIQQRRASDVIQRSPDEAAPANSCDGEFASSPTQQEWFSDEVLIKIRNDPPGANKQLLAQSSTNPKVQQAIRLVQRALIAWGCEVGKKTLPLGAADGMYTPETRDAVKAFQAGPREVSGAALAIDGKVGPLTVRELDLFVSKEKSQPTPTPTPTPTPLWKSFKITMKSFIAPIGNNYSKTGCVVGPETDRLRLGAMATATDLTFGERSSNTNDRMDNGYRLFSSRRFYFRFDPKEPELTSGIAGKMETDVGNEPASGGLEPDPLIVSPDVFKRIGNRFVFAWRGKGCPHPLAEVGLQMVCPRTGRYIWHEVAGIFEIGPDGIELSTSHFAGSKFPTHKLYVNGDQTDWIPQHDFGLLWKHSPKDKALVG